MYFLVLYTAEAKSTFLHASEQVYTVLLGYDNET